VQAWWRELGFPAEQLAAAVTLTPSCGLAGASPDYARAAMAHVREAAKYLQPN
jgi:methionine synthase II (cobalamin-independent)